VDADLCRHDGDANVLSLCNNFSDGHEAFVLSGSFAGVLTHLLAGTA
jgi:hypothetical protein